jgi:tetratricopeptide (TPR) repeat protein
MSVKTSRIAFILYCFALLFQSCNNPEPKSNSDQVNSSGIKQPDMTSLSIDDPVSYQKILETDSLNTSVRLKLAAYYYTNQEFDKALNNNLIVIRIDKDNLAAIFNLGNIYYDTQQYKQAIVYYEKFLEKDNKNSNVRCDLATCYMNLNNTDKAISLLRENIKLDNKHPQSHYNLSVILKQTGKSAEADEEMKIYTNLISAQPGMVQ